MTIGNAIVNMLFRNYIHTILERDAKGIKNALNKTIHKSDNMIVSPYVEKLDLERIDDLHDKVTITYDDYKIEFIITWGKTKVMLNHYAVMSIEMC